MVQLPRCVLFDLDGTILDSLPGIESSVRAAFASCGLPIPRTPLGGIIGPPIRTILAQVGAIADEKTLDALETAFRREYDTTGWQATICFPGAVRALHVMRARGHRLFVVSNKPRHISLRILEKEAILDTFETVITRDSRVPAFTGKEEMIGFLLAQREMQPAECAMVGDTMEDAKAAATAGIGFVYMTHGYGSADEELAPGVCAVDSFAKFLPLIAEELVRD
jgi:phosphoglycolate phosphatase